MLRSRPLRTLPAGRPQTDDAGNTSAAATDYFRLDRSTLGPYFNTLPDDVSSESTPTWTYFGESGADYECTLTRSGSDTPIDEGPCNSGTYTFDLGAYPDDTYTLSVVLTDPLGNRSEPATDSFRLDRPEPNTAPAARFSFACTGLACTVDAGGSSDADGTITNYAWEFGDGATGNGETAQHGYTQPGTYTVKLTVTDDDGASATTSKAITPIRLTARGYKVNGRPRVDLAWTGSSANGFDLYRNGRRIADVSGHSYTDRLARRGPGTYSYAVCAFAGPLCSNPATVRF
jgi:chitodextrinase